MVLERNGIVQKYVEAWELKELKELEEMLIATSAINKKIEIKQNQQL